MLGKKCIYVLIKISVKKTDTKNLILISFADIDECISEPCHHGGRCVDRINKYVCICDDTGYTGLNCETGK